MDPVLRLPRRWLPPLTALVLAGCAAGADTPRPGAGLAQPATPNDNREAAGTLRGGVRTVQLEARLALWQPDADVDSAVTVQAFAEPRRAPSIPGPLLRAEQGRELRVTLRNLLADSTLVVHGLRAGRTAEDTVQVAPGATREVTVRTDVPGTYLYWGSTTGTAIDQRWDRDGQLTGALVIDSAGVAPDPRERIFVLTLIDIYPDSGDPRRRNTKEDIWEVAINGRSWPHTERLAYTVGDTVRWRWVNGTLRSHPMHLHGFHFRTLARGDGRTDTTFAADRVPHAVTELMAPGGTMRMAWVPTRAGNWLMHCHMLPHVTPYPARPDSARAHEAHDVTRHALDAMSGLVLGVTVAERGGGSGPEPAVTPAQRLRLLVQQARADTGRWRASGYVLQRGAEEPRADSVQVPGPTLVLTRGQATEITVVNRLSHPTTVHWHGMELLSVYDGVSGWSGLDAQRAPLVAPGDSFTVAITPPRSGTFMYHTHMDESEEVTTGLYGAMLVLEPDETWDPATDLPMVFGVAVVGGTRMHVLNGAAEPAARTLRVGTAYRIRLLNIGPVLPARLSFTSDGRPVPWRQVAKDGATLPTALQQPRTTPLWTGVGETYDFTWTPRAAGEVVLEMFLPDGLPAVRQAFRVVGRDARQATSTRTRPPAASDDALRRPARS